MRNHGVHWKAEPLWLNRASTERVAQATAQPSGDERNDQKSLDRVAETKASISRKESDIAAIKRELAKLPQ